MSIDEVRDRRQELENELAAHTTEDRERIRIRAKLINVMFRELKLEPDLAEKNRIKAEIDNHIKIVSQQLKSQLNDTKQKKESLWEKIPKELSYKGGQVANDVRALRSADTVWGKLGNGAKAAGHVISTVGSVVKAPVVGALSMLEAASPLLGTILVAPLHIPAYLMGKLINPDSKYNGKGINNVGEGLGKAIENVLDAIETGVRKL